MPEKQNILKRLDRDHPVLSEDSPLNRQILRATGLPDMKSLVMALAHPMTEDDTKILAQKAGGHQAHHNRIKHLREHAIKKHGHVGESHPDDEEEAGGRYPRGKKLDHHGHQSHEDAGLGEYEYLHKAFRSVPFVPLLKARSVIGREISKPGTGGVQAAPPVMQEQPKGNKYKPQPEEQATPSPRGTTMSGAPSRHHVSYDPQAGRTRLAHHHIDGAGYLALGAGPAPFRAKASFDMNDQGDRAVHDTLRKMGHSDPSTIGNTVLYQDFMPDPHDPTKGLGNTAAPDSERSQMATNISAAHGGVTKEQVHSVLDKIHAQAYEQFQAHPMHHMDDVMIPHETKTGERTMKHEVPRDPVTNLPAHKTAATKPVELKHLARQIRWWQSTPEDQKNATRKWYGTEAHEYIKDLSRAAKVSYLKAAGALALYNNGMGWETGASGAAQSLFNDSLGVQYQSDGTHNEPTGEVDPDTGKDITTPVPHSKGDPMTIIRQTYPEVRKKIRDIAAAPEGNHDEVLKRIRKHLKTNKLGNFFMDMIGAAPYATNTNDRHELAMAGHTFAPGTVKGNKDFSGLPRETASDAEHRYFWRVKNAVAHQLDVDPREVQAANWVGWRRDKQTGTDKGENFPGWKVAREFVDRKMLDGAGSPGERNKIQRRIDDRKNREIDLANIMPGLPTVQPGMSKQLTREVKKERTRLAKEMTDRKRKGAEAVLRQQEQWAAGDPVYARKREAAAQRTEEEKRRKMRAKLAAAEPQEEQEELASSFAQWEIDFYNENLRKSYEALECRSPLTYLLLKH